MFTNAKISHEEAVHLAEEVNFGFASRIFPYSTSMDGDTVFSVSSGQVTANSELLFTLARQCAEKAVVSIFKHEVYR